MKYLSIDLSTLRSPEYIGSTPTERGTWLSVLGYCADQENGGRIVGAMTWKDRQWQQVCGVTLREVRSTTRLLLIEGDDVIVFDYPLYLEEEIRKRRVSGRVGGQARTQAKAQAARDNGAKNKSSGPQAKTQAEPKECLKQNPSGTQGVLEANTQAQPKQTPNVREGNVMEGKVSNTERQAPPAGDAGLPLPGFDRNLATSDGQHDTSPAPGPENPAAAKETAEDAKPAEVQGGTLPAELETETFRAAWADWLAYRRECKVSPYKPRALAAQLAMLAEWGHDVAIESIRQSIRQQWRGLFEPKASFGSGSAHGVSAESKKRSDKIAKTNGYEY